MSLVQVLSSPSTEEAVHHESMQTVTIRTISTYNYVLSQQAILLVSIHIRLSTLVILRMVRTYIRR